MGVGQLTPMGMRQMHLRGREIRKRYILDRQFLSPVVNPDEIYAYSTDVDRTYQSALSFMTGMYPAGGPQKLWENQTAIAKPPINIENFEEINSKLESAALENNFQTVPVHSDAGNMNSMIFRGFDPMMCPIIGEIQMFQLSNKTSVNETFERHTKTLYPMLAKKFNISGDIDINIARYILEEVYTNKFEQRYMPYTFTEDEWKQMD